MRQQAVVIFGGAGFIGSHLAQHFLANENAKKIYLVDIRTPEDGSRSAEILNTIQDKRIRYTIQNRARLRYYGYSLAKCRWSVSLLR